MSRVRLCLLAASLALVALPSCGDVGESHAPALTPEGRAADGVRAGRAALRLADLPRGWQQDRSAAPPDRCSAYLAGLTRTAHVERSFTANVVEADSEVGVFATAGQARTAFRRLGAGAQRACLERELRRRLNASPQVASGAATIADISVGPLPSSSYGDEAAAIRIVVAISQKSANIELHSDLVVVRRDRGLLIATLATQDGDFDRDLKSRLLRTLAGRLGAGGSPG